MGDSGMDLLALRQQHMHTHLSWLTPRLALPPASNQEPKTKNQQRNVGASTSEPTCRLGSQVYGSHPDSVPCQQ